MWSLYENEKELNPLVFSNGKSQADIVKEIIEAINEGNKIIFLKGMCGTGKSAIALNLAKKLGKTTIVVPIKSLQEQYTKDYTGKKYVLRDGKKLNILSLVGRKNFKCRFFEEGGLNDLRKTSLEKNTTLTEIFSPNKRHNHVKISDNSCDNNYLPCKIEIKEKNLDIIKKFLRKNPLVKVSDFSSINEVKRMSIAPVCPYWSPILPEEFDKKFKDEKKIKYEGLKNKFFIIHQRKPGCPYYDQYTAYNSADVIIFNSAKYLIENLMDRKPSTEVDIIDECDDFLDSFANQEQINLNRLSYSLGMFYSSDKGNMEVIKSILNLSSQIKDIYGSKNDPEEIHDLEDTPVKSILKLMLDNPEILDDIETEETSYLNHLNKVARTFEGMFDETFFSIEKRENDIIIHLVTTNLAKKLNELLEKNKTFIMMSGTIHSESVLRNIFGIEKFKVIEAEIQHQGSLEKCRYGYEMDCSYASFKNNEITREDYLRSFSKCVAAAKRPVLIHMISFSDLPTEHEKLKYGINNIPTQNDLISEQESDPFGKRVNDFRNKKTDVLFTTKCSRGIDFPGDTCNSIIITRFPYPNISSIFWKILKKTKPTHFMSFYMDKSRRELLQKIYRGLRSKTDKVYLLSPDIRVLDFEFEKK